jgi:hypothetical protein
MSTSAYFIREVRADDDLAAMLRLLNETAKRWNRSPNFNGLGMTIEDLRYEADRNNLFIAEADGQLAAVMCVYPSSLTGHGTIIAGYSEGNEYGLRLLIQRCEQRIAANGGKKLVKHVMASFGQVRNQEITLWESMGFTSDEYSSVACILNLSDWQEPDEIDLTGIEPAVELENEQILRFMIEDGEEAGAALFDRQYSGTMKDQVVLKLSDPASGELQAVAYYRVQLTSHEQLGEFYNAIAFGIHLRPQYSLDLKEIRRFLQAALLSMKQFDIQYVSTKMTLKHFNLFAAMTAEGFTNRDVEQASSIRLTKRIQGVQQ